jgi:hypothetical protein
MLNLRRLGAIVFLTCILGSTAWADCPVPGVMDGPPCTVAPIVPDDSTPNDSSAPGIMGGPPAVVAEVPSVDLPSLAEIALNVLMLF